MFLLVIANGALKTTNAIASLMTVTLKCLRFLIESFVKNPFLLVFALK